MFNILKFGFSKTPFRVYRGYLIPKPPPKPKSKFNLFYSDLAKQKKEQNSSLTIKEAAKLWESIPKDQSESLNERLNKDKMEYQRKLEEYNKKWIEKLKPIPNKFRKFLQVKLPEIGKQKSGTEAYTEALSIWSKLQPKEKKQYEVSVEQHDKNLEDVKEFKIPELKQSSEEGIKKNRQMVGEFCKKHGITAEELYKLMEEADHSYIKTDSTPGGQTKKTKKQSPKKQQKTKSEAKKESQPNPQPTQSGAHKESTTQHEQIRSTLDSFKDMR